MLNDKIMIACFIAAVIIAVFNVTRSILTERAIIKGMTERDAVEKYKIRPIKWLKERRARKKEEEISEWEK